MKTPENSIVGQGSHQIDLQWFFLSLVNHWKLFLVCILVGLLFGFFYLRYSVKSYSISASVILKDDKKGGMGNSELSVYEGMRLVNPNSNVDNEVEMFISRNLVGSVVRELGLYTRYFVQGRFKNTELYGISNARFYRQSPVLVWMADLDIDCLSSSVFIDIKKSVSGYRVDYRIGGDDLCVSFDELPYLLKTSLGNILLQPSTVSALREEYPLHVVISPVLGITRSYLSRLSAEATSKTTSVVRLSLQDTHWHRGEAFLSKLIDMYNRDAMEDKNTAAMNASRFIGDRLLSLGKDLSRSEAAIESYKRDNSLTDLSAESYLFLSEDNEFNKELICLGTDIELLALLRGEVEGGVHHLLPANLGLSDPNLVSLLGRYNSAFLEKEKFSTYSSSDNPLMGRLEERLVLLREDILAQLDGLEKTFATREKDVKRQSRIYSLGLHDIPRREREYQEMSRQQQIKANLFTTLLQKKEEAELSLAVTAPSAKILNSPLVGGSPVSPRAGLTYGFCFLLGFLLPYGFLGLRELINFKLEDKSEVERRSRVPIIISLPIDKHKTPLVVSVHSTTPIVERFRLLRLNLQYSLDRADKKVILVTSTISGEGKTFVSINLAMTFALKYKTLLVGLDIRRPKLSSYIHLLEKEGIVSYLSGMNRNIDSLIQKDVNGTGLDVLVAGPVPPNPNELLMESSLDELFVELRKGYDYIIVDTSPVGSVSDPFLLNRISDACLFVVRHNYTPKAALSLSNGILEENRLKNLHLVLNGFENPQAGRYGYGYGYGYGYSSQQG